MKRRRFNLNEYGHIDIFLPMVMILLLVVYAAGELYEFQTGTQLLEKVPFWGKIAAAIAVTIVVLAGAAMDQGSRWPKLEGTGFPFFPALGISLVFIVMIFTGSIFYGVIAGGAVILAGVLLGE